MTKITDDVKDYYGKVLNTNKDLQTNACCATETMPKTHKDILKQLDPEILDKFYGCGAPLPPALVGCTTLDLGSGSGRDVYLLSHLVGENGFSYGIDMTDEQLDIANKYIDSQTKKFGFAKPNVAFTKGYIEDLKSAGIDDNTIDLIISNCVINLSPDKPAVFKEIFRALKPGGEMFISDVFADRRVPQVLQDDPVLYGECLTGALYIEDFRRILADIGCKDYRVFSSRQLTVENPEIEAKLGNIKFYSITVRAFKLDLEDICEDYGQTATYNGKIAEHPHHFVLDDHHVFETGKPMLVCGNTADMVSKTRYAKYFTVTGNKSTHFGPFDCGPDSASAWPKTASTLGGCC